MSDEIETSIQELIINALSKRQPMISPGHDCAIRLFNGFYEGSRDLVADLYGNTLVLFSHAENEEESIIITQLARDIYLEALPWIKCVLVKHHNARDKDLRNGLITFGSHLDESILEHGIKYALDLKLNQDASFYLDTRNLRKWIIAHSGGLEVLNTFAYTGSLGVAALAGGAASVFQLDRNRKFLDMARRSAMLNRLDLGKMKLAAVDFFVGIGQLKRSGALFDMVILDPPFFSVTEKGMVDQAKESHRLVNKVRPLLRDGGRIVAINNSLFLAGTEYVHSLEALGQDGFVEIEEIIPVPEDITGFPETKLGNPPIDPAPFNHPTKMVVLKVKRKK
ncbi:MAG: SAM-dependent methyltransferase [Chloroflexi bacterium HGW-Chloroflexi-5]|jgi:23S rRNA (cytosine1962-C5)-methyltransferase|nr:MAG: SAM-dependent methyltransferase [Chloroflexi bacterium HGW-Chloroflexi-5]